MNKKGIVIVSHSQKLAEGVKELIDEMNDGSVTVIAAGGTEDGRIGTNAFKIMNAIEELADSAYILVYADLGSSILSTETALDMLDEDLVEKVKIVDCPLVEGAFTGVVQACVSDEPEEVIRVSEETKTMSKV